MARLSPLQCQLEQSTRYACGQGRSLDKSVVIEYQDGATELSLDFRKEAPDRLLQHLTLLDVLINIT